MTAVDLKEKLGALLRRRSHAASEKERLATEEELRAIAAEARPPHQKAERRPSMFQERR